MTGLANSTQTFSDQGAARAASPGAPYLFVVLEAARPLAGGARLRLDALDEVVIGRAPSRAVAFDTSEGRRRAVLGLPDARVSGKHASISRTGVGWTLRDHGSRNGTFVDGRAIKTEILDGGCCFEVGSTTLCFHARLDATEGDAFVESSALPYADVGLATLLPGRAAELDAFAKIAASDVPILLLGATGSGKEVAARAAHALSGRRGPFVPVNCGALPETLLESQLFGHTKGAFSGATRDEVGLVRASHEGTLFLDEIGDMPRPSQVALLRVIQEREVTPVGETRPVPVDLRVVAATHQRVDALEGGGFRDDLYARLAGFTLRLPPLAERVEDLGLLVATLLPRVAPRGAEALTLGPELARAMVTHDWPMNVRELEQALRVTSVLAEGGVMALDHAPESLRAPRSSASSAAPDSPEDAALRESLVDALRRHSGNVSRVAKELERTRMQIHRWMKRLAIDPEEFRP